MLRNFKIMNRGGCGNEMVMACSHIQTGDLSGSMRITIEQLQSAKLAVSEFQSICRCTISSSVETRHMKCEV
jgi:hypothetical protein